MDVATPLPEWPAPERNKGPILEVLRRVLPETGTLLEIASGTGQHAAHFAASLPGVTVQPSDFDSDNLAVINERVRRSKLDNLRLPVSLDVCDPHWPVEHADAIFNANMIHIAPWEATLGLFAGAAHLLDEGQRLVTYGPYQVDGVHTSESNARFDVSLRDRDSRWGVRDLTRVADVAAEHAFTLVEKVTMPANNLTVVWAKRG